MPKSRMRELLWGQNHKEERLQTDKVLCPKNGRHKILLPDILRRGRNLRSCHQANNFLYYVKGVFATDTCMYALLARLCRAVIIKLLRRVIKLTALKWKCKLDSYIAYPGSYTGQSGESEHADGYWRAQPPMPHPREGVG